MAAGDSAAREAARHTSDEHARLAGVATQLAHSYAAATRSERRLAEALIELEPLGWTLLADRLHPGSPHAKLDFALVGPGGVFLVDVTRWRGARVADGRVFHGDADGTVADVTAELERFADLAYVTQSGLAEVGLPAGEVHALAVSTSHPAPAVVIYGVEVLGEHDAVLGIARRGARLTTQQVNVVRRALERLFPPRATGPIATIPDAVAAWSAERRPAAEPLSATEVLDALLAGLAAEPLEEWMSFLHPAQARIVCRTFDGPARLRGAAGTGKTVVALHRAAHLARTTGARVLVTSFATVLPLVLESQLRRFAPDVADRVDFLDVHAVAQRLLRERDVHPRVDGPRAERVWQRVWSEHGDALAPLEEDPRYWRDEVRRIIKGRGVASFEQYAMLARIGRRRPLTLEQRRTVWSIFEAYQALLASDGVIDGEDLVLEAERSVRERPATGYGAVIVDEAQDLSCAAIRMLHLLVGNRPDGLLLVGDGQQSIHPGGYTLAEAGVPIAGRSVVLTTNHRNTAQILSVAESVVEGDIYPGVEDRIMSGQPNDPGAARTGPSPVVREFDSPAAHDESLVSHIWDLFAHDPGLSPGDIAVLALTTRGASEATRVLEAAGIRTLDLHEDDGRVTGAVKVGTVKHAKGLEFKEVLVARAPHGLVGARAWHDRVDTGLTELRDLQRRSLYVAMTRARDGLWVGVA